jgi:hypothetical protein
MQRSRLVAPRTSEAVSSEKIRRSGNGWGPFSSKQLTTIVCVAIVSAVLIPTAAMAAVGSFSSATATPAVTATNSSASANATAVLANASGTNTKARWGVNASATGTKGIGVQGTGAKYGVYSDGPLGVAAGKSLSCTGCVTPGDLSTSVGGRLLYSQSSTFNGPYTNLETVASFTVPAGLMCASGTASAYAMNAGVTLTVSFVAATSDSTGLVVNLELLANEVGSHKALVGQGTVCTAVGAGTYSFMGVSGNGTAVTDPNDVGSLSVQVFSQ